MLLTVVFHRLSLTLALKSEHHVARDNRLGNMLAVGLPPVVRRVSPRERPTTAALTSPSKDGAISNTLSTTSGIKKRVI